MKNFLKTLPFALAAILIVGGLVYLHKTAPQAEASFNGYTYQRTLTVANASSTQSSFPVLVCFNVTQGNGNACPTATDLKASSSGGSIMTLNASSTPNDLVFSTSTTATGLLPFEIENYVSTTGELEAWVNMPTVSNGQVLYMYYGNTAASNQATTTGVWGGNYQLIYHLNDNAANTTVKDSTYNASTGTANQNTNNTHTAGQVGGAFTFNGTSDSISGPTITYGANAPISLSAWVYSTDNSEAVNDISMNNSNFELYTFFGRPTFTDCNSYMAAISGSTISTSAWHYLVGTFDGSTTTIYVDGAFVASVTGCSYTSGGGAYQFGSRSGSYFFHGNIDEERVSSIAPSADWIKTEYNNQSNDNTFWTTGAANNGTSLPTDQLIVNNSKVIFNKGQAIFQ